MGHSDTSSGSLPYLMAAAMASAILFVLGSKLLLHPLRSYPGPFTAKFTDAYAGYHAAKKRLHLATYSNHIKYGWFTLTSLMIVAVF
ncbi:putative cytochrome P450 [Rosellinia necatrix]|uniref:Putative cytochrome P450 n=1 Tax=Rosellinia necatrix TaxID=77044 RepID=A0A1S8AB66_ROSNE|nr:putative cytochrome P450 [Rosellinia necatrix]